MGRFVYLPTFGCCFLVNSYIVILVIFRNFCASWVVPGLDPSYIELWRWNPGMPKQYLSRRNLEEYCSCPVFKAWPGASIYVFIFFGRWFFHGSCILWIDFKCKKPGRKNATHWWTVFGKVAKIVEYYCYLIFSWFWVNYISRLTHTAYISTSILGIKTCSKYQALGIQLRHILSWWLGCPITSKTQSI